MDNFNHWLYHKLQQIVDNGDELKRRTYCELTGYEWKYSVAMDICHEIMATLRYKLTDSELKDLNIYKTKDRDEIENTP